MVYTTDLATGFPTGFLSLRLTVPYIILSVEENRLYLESVSGFPYLWTDLADKTGKTCQKHKCLSLQMLPFSGHHLVMCSVYNKLTSNVSTAVTDRTQ